MAFFTTAAFANSPAGRVTGVPTPIPLSATDIANIGKFLRVLNAAFNASISIQRNNAALTLENSSGTSGGGNPRAREPGEETGNRQTVNRMLALSNTEATDAIEVLSEKGLHPDAVTLLNSAISKNSQAINELSSDLRATLIQGAINDLNAAKAKFGTGLTFNLGEGNLMF